MDSKGLDLLDLEDYTMGEQSKLVILMLYDSREDPAMAKELVTIYRGFANNRAFGDLVAYCHSDVAKSREMYNLARNYLPPYWQSGPAEPLVGVYPLVFFVWRGATPVNFFPARDAPESLVIGVDSFFLRDIMEATMWFLETYSIALPKSKTSRKNSAEQTKGSAKEKDSRRQSAK